MLDVEVLVVGAGPAGACAALNLAPLRSTLVVDRRARPRARLVESLPPVAGRLLADMGLLEAFRAEDHARWQVKRSIWERDEPVEVDLLRDPDGLGWHLDRPRFGVWLRSVALARGATLLAPADIVGIEGGPPSGWRVRLSTAAGGIDVSAAVVIDAAGRSAPLASHLGARRQRLDRLVCGWVEGRDWPAPPGGEAGRRSETYLEATPDGWWYTAAATEGARVLAFHTDADLPAASTARDPRCLLHAARTTTTGLAELLTSTGFEPTGGHGFTAAHSAVLRPCAGPGWLAAGDAALSLDPVSSQGLLTALVTGLAAAEAADQFLDDVDEPAADYARMLAGIEARYVTNLADCYGAVRRWSAHPFWARRQGLPRTMRRLASIDGLEDATHRAR